ADAIRDVLASAGRAIDSADYRDVIPRAVSKMVGALRTAIVAHPVARLGGSRRRRGRPAEGVIPLKRGRGHGMDGHRACPRDVLAGEADDLAVLVDCLALLDLAQGVFGPQAASTQRAQRTAIAPDSFPWLRVRGGARHVVFRTKMDSDLGQRHGWHCVAPDR